MASLSSIRPPSASSARPTALRVPAPSSKLPSSASTNTNTASRLPNLAPSDRTPPDGVRKAARVVQPPSSGLGAKAEGGGPGAGATRERNPTARGPPAGAGGSDEAQRTIRRPARVLQSAEAAEGPAGAGGPAPTPSMTRLPLHRPPSAAPGTVPPAASLSTLRPFPSTTSHTTPSKRKQPTPNLSTVLDPSASPATVRARTRSIASQALTKSLSRSTSSTLDNPQTVRPRRTLKSDVKEEGTVAVPSPRTRKKATLAGLGRPDHPSLTAARPPSLSSDQRSASSLQRPVSSSIQRSASDTVPADRTPLRTSTRRPSTSSPSTSLKPSSSLARPSHRRTPTASSIPVVAGAGRTLKKLSTQSTLSTASTATTDSSRTGASEASSMNSAIAGAMRRHRLSADARLAAPPPATAGRRGSATLARSPGKPRSTAGSRTPAKTRPPSVSHSKPDLSASQISRRESWETVGSGRPSLGSTTFDELEPPPPSSPSSVAAPRIALAPPPDASLSFATPQKPSEPLDLLGDATPLPSRAALSYISPDTTLSRLSHASFLSPACSADSPGSALLNASLASIAPSPAPAPRPRQLTLLGGGGGARNKPRDSASLEEMLKIGLQSGDGEAREWELLLDEGSSVLMRQEIGAHGEGGGGLTPWRGRVVSLSRSRSRREVDDVAEEAEGLEDEEQGEEQGGEQRDIVILQQSSTEARDLRRRVEELLAELERAKREGSVAQEELELARREKEAWEEERRGMESDLEDLAAAAAAAAASRPPPPPSPPPPPAEPEHAPQLARLRLEHQQVLALSAFGTSTATWEGIAARAAREREELAAEMDALRVVAGGLGAWQALCV
ncbi:hypothetical protein JCM1840_004774 [Sporobolomyces johnsonii]